MIITVIKSSFRALFSPKAFFNDLSEQYSFVSALVFYCVLFVIIPCVALLAAAIAATFGNFPIGTAFSTATFIPLLIAILVYSVISVALILAVSIIMHVFVLLFLGKGKFSGTFNVLVYSNAANILYQLLFATILITTFSLKSAGFFMPVMIIALVGVLWLMAIPVIGYKAIHKMGTLRAFAAFYIPVFIFFGIAFAAYPSLNKLKSKMPSAYSIKSALAQVKEQRKTKEPKTSSTINWRYSLNGALSAAAREGKPLMVDFYTDWCSWCKKLDQYTYGDNSIRVLAEQFVCVKVNADRDKSSVTKYGVKSYPTVLFLGPAGNVISKITGYVDARNMSGAMKKVLAKYPAKKEPIQLNLPIPALLQGASAKYRLTAIGFSDGKPNAVINDMIVRAGDSIGDAKVIDIEKSRVIMLSDGKEIVLEL